MKDGDQPPCSHYKDLVLYHAIPSLITISWLLYTPWLSRRIPPWQVPLTVVLLPAPSNLVSQQSCMVRCRSRFLLLVLQLMVCEAIHFAVFGFAICSLLARHIDTIKGHNGCPLLLKSCATLLVSTIVKLFIWNI